MTRTSVCRTFDVLIDAADFDITNKYVKDTYAILSSLFNLVRNLLIWLGNNYVKSYPTSENIIQNLNFVLFMSVELKNTVTNYRTNYYVYNIDI